MIELKDASLAIEGQPLFSKLSFIARDGQLTCITGPAGSGKTLLARVMIGLQPLDEGFVNMDGELLTPLSASAFRRLTTYIPQAIAPAPVAFVPETGDLEESLGSLSPLISRPIPELRSPTRSLSLLTSHSSPLTSRPSALVIADDPPLAQLDALKGLAASGCTVIVMSQQEEYLRSAAQTVYLE